MFRVNVFALVLFTVSAVLAKPNFKPINSNELENQFQRSIYFLLKNTSPADGVKGSVIAAPSKSHPDYYYHWVRDAALVVDSLLNLYLDPRFKNQAVKTQIRAFLLDHVQFNSKIQISSQSFKGLGEPKFWVTGLPFTGPWGRPQNDGPALRASTHARILDVALREKWPEVNQLAPFLYAAKIPANSLIKRDTEFVAHHWREPNFDLWEEVYGMHFYTLLAQRKSLLFGASVANAFKDQGAAQFYTTQAKQIGSTLESFWSQGRGYIEATKFVQRGRNKSQLDSAVLLGALHSEIEDAHFSVADPRVLASFLRMKSAFASIYTINKNTAYGTAIGRYPEDTYDGYNTNSRGNPWVLSTAAGAEYLYRLMMNHLKKKQIQINDFNRNYYADLSGSQLKTGQVLTPMDRSYSLVIKGLFEEADSYLTRVLFHRNADGSLSEQMNRENGYMQGAPNLTWSHASIITAKLRRDEALSVGRAFLK
ncbi:MAG: glycoside hydrolase family 15 protein [Bdellovibrionaceae bacterium]|nr:glycoside hydrolase family 15 protein [Pseudobdellovibrionaceae bacterium]